MNKEKILKKLAIQGGDPIRTKPFPTTKDSSGRCLGEEEITLLKEVINSGSLNRNNGNKVKQFEKEFSRKMNGEYVVACSSGTAALHTAVAAINVSPGDEIITSPITDMGTIIAILRQNAIPIFADTHPRSGNLDPESLETKITKRTKAVIPVHLFGQPCNMEPIIDIAKENNFYIIEDCAQAYLAEYEGKKVGTIGNIGCFSLQQSKQITTGDGGIIITKKKELADRSRLFTDKCYPRQSGDKGIPFLGLNYRMTELQGAVALGQLKKIENIVSRRRKTANLLSNMLKEIKGISPMQKAENTKSSYWAYSFMIDEDELGVKTEKFIKGLNAEGIPFRVGYRGGPIRGLERAPLILEWEVLKKKRT